MSLHSPIAALTVALMVTLTGCATSGHVPAPQVVISESTWQQIDSDIIAASQAATTAVQNYARGSMASWKGLVHRRTDADFIPWFTSYWTQQWLTMKVAWYKMSTGKESDPTVNRLATYLQEQYHDRVLDPVAKEIDPDEVMEHATKAYVQLLGEQLQGVAQRYAVPQDQFDRRLQGIPAIALAPPAAHSASLYQIVHADPLARLPAYVALVDRFRNVAGSRTSGTGLSSLAKRTSEKLAAELTTSGVASAAAAVVGRAAGMVISLGVAGFSAIARENERPDMEVQLRKNLNTAFDEEWLSLMENPATGVLAGVYYLSGQIEGSLASADALPAKFEPLPRVVNVPGEQPLQDGRGGYDAPPDGWNADQ